MEETSNIAAWADHVTITIVIVTVAHGMLVAAYESTALGLRCLGSAFGGFALQESLRRELVSLDVPADVANAMGLVLCVATLFFGSTWLLRRIEARQGFRAPRLPGPIDALLGGASGLATGLTVAGLLQVVWMMPVIPGALRIDHRLHLRAERKSPRR